MPGAWWRQKTGSIPVSGTMSISSKGKDLVDILDRIYITEDAFDAWTVMSRQAVMILPVGSAAEIGDEQAEELPDGSGSLRLFVLSTRTGQVLVEMIVPSDQWGWLE